MARTALSMTPLAPAPVSPHMREVLMWGIALVGVVVLFWILVVVGRRLLARRLGGSATEGLTLERLEILRGSGQITAEEFRLLRRKILGLAGGKRETDESSSSCPGEDDDADRGSGPAGPPSDSDEEG